jgi:hypothetical protein
MDKLVITLANHIHNLISAKVAKTMLITILK